MPGGAFPVDSMMELNISMLIHLLLGPLLLLIALLYFCFPPKRINWFYGYRTSRSMRSQQAWDDSNRYSSRLLLRIALLVCLFQSAALLFVGAMHAILPAVIILTLAVLAVIPLTERRLRRLFDETGAPKAPGERDEKS